MHDLAWLRLLLQRHSQKALGYLFDQLRQLLTFSREVLLIKSVILAAGLVAYLPPAQAQKKVDEVFASEMERYEEQETSAQQDIALATNVMKEYFLSAKYPKGIVVPAAVNQALSPLKERYPDYRLNYVAKSDYCPALHAIEDAMSAARRRLTSALYEKQRVLALSAAYHGVVVKVLSGEMLGNFKPEDDIADAFTSVLEATKQDTELGWSGMDYSEADPGGPADECDR